MLDVRAYLHFLTDACERYEKTAPTVCDHCDDLFRRIEGAPGSVTLLEMGQVMGLRRDGEWMHHNFAANMIYKLRERLAMDTTGHVGF